MKITLITTNKKRHNYLINLLSSISEKLFVIQECMVKNPERISGNYKTSKIIKKYFEKVNEAETALFKNSYVNKLNKKIKILSINYGELVSFSTKSLSEYLFCVIFFEKLISFISSLSKKDLLTAKPLLLISTTRTLFVRSFFIDFDEQLHVIFRDPHFVI